MSAFIHVIEHDGSEWYERPGVDARIAELEVENARHIETALDTNEALYKAEAELLDLRIKRDNELLLLEREKRYSKQVEAEVTRLRKLFGMTERGTK